MVVTKHTLLIIDCSLRDGISTDMTLVLNFIRVVFKLQMMGIIVGKIGKFNGKRESAKAGCRRQGSSEDLI